MGRYSYVICDVFTAQPLAGNALCVFTDARGLDAVAMQRLARETNLSETTFVFPAGDAEGDVAVRIFTPAAELPFAGHPLIGTAAVLGGSLPFERLTLATGSGPIAIDLDRRDGRVRGATMVQPQPLFDALAEAPALCAALGLSDRAVAVADNGTRTALVEATADELAGLAPDLAALGRVGGASTCLVYADDGGETVRARVFAPWEGIAEDPGTGSAAGPLAAHLGRSISILQGVEMGRPCEIEVELPEDGRPRVTGAVTVVGRGYYVL